jgi:hypothetical protein
MPTVHFKAKIEALTYVDGTSAGERIKVPEIKSHHWDRESFRRAPRYSSYVNSDLMPGLVRRAIQALGVREYLHLDALPQGVDVDRSGFLAQVTITLPDRA